MLVGAIDFELPPEAEQLRVELRDWLQAHLTDAVIDAAQHRGGARQFEILLEWDRTMATAGWATIDWPVEYGGRGATVLEQLVFTEETTLFGCPTPVNVIGLNNIAPAIMQFGTERQRTELLPRMRTAEEIWCQGMSEPDAGSDLASLRTSAVVDGDSFVVNGQKTWTSVAHHADWCALFVRTDPDAPKHKGISCLIVDMSIPGIEVRPLVTLGADAEFNEVFFDDVRVPKAALLGPLNAGWSVATSTLSHERAGAARLYAMTTRRLRRLVNDLATAPAEHGYGSPAQDPCVLERLGALDVRLAYLKVLCQRSISMALTGKDPSAQSSLAKTVWGELEQDVAALGFDVFGWDGADGSWARDRCTTRSLTIAGGTTQVVKNITAQRVLGLPRN